MQIKNLNLSAYIFGALLAVGLLPVLASAQGGPPELLLSINGGSSANVVDGEEVEIEWYISGSVNNCVLRRNGTTIQTIDTSSTPLSGSFTETPPTGASTDYSVTCSGINDSVQSVTKPIITMTLPQGNTRTIDPNSGWVESVDVNWDAQYATECSDVWVIQENPDRTYVASHSSDYSNKNRESGRVRFDGHPHWSINSDTTFYITCSNFITGAEETSSVSLTVIDPPPPQPPLVNVWTNNETITTDPLYGYAIADVRFNSQGVTSCSYEAFYEDGTEYDSLPSGYGTWSGHTSRTFTGIRIAATTDFRVTCSRGAYEIDGINYPSTSTSDTVRVTVVPDPNGVSDRSLLPPVTVSATVTPNPAVKNAVTGEAYISIETNVQNADYCYQYAYEYDSDTGEYDDRYELDGWTLEHGWNRRGNGDRTFGAYIEEDTLLEINCRREYDYVEGNPAEYENGTEVISVVVQTEESTLSAPPPVTYLYGNAYVVLGKDIWSDRTASNGFKKISDRIEVDGFTSGNSISFPFEHPYGGAGVYNIHVQYYDEDDGESYFRLLSEDDGLLASWVSNDPLASGSNANDETLTSRLVAAGVSLEDGDIITLECDAPSNTEKCRTQAVYFGSGNGGSVAVPSNPATGFTDVSLAWLSENTTDCAYAEATVPGFSSYTWVYGPDVTGDEEVSISTSTRFSIKCYRDGDGQNATSFVEARLPETVSLEAQILVASGECVDPVTLNTTTAPDGFTADTDPSSPTYRQCVPSVDLAAASPSFSQGPENNVDGTYDTIDTLMLIRNLGPGDLPSGKNIAYMGRMTFQSVFALPTIDTLVGSFNGAITAAEIESPTLTRTFTDVPFGTHTVCSRVNLDNSPNNYPEASTNFANNQNCTTITLPVPRPDMPFTADREVIRTGQQVEINWAVNVTYGLDCTVRGAGGLDETFDTLIEGPGHTDSFTTNPLTSTSEFVFQCTEPITGTVFTERLTVEVVPDFEEI